MPTLFDAVLTLILALALSCLHAIKRPVIDEYYFIQQSQSKTVPCLVHSDGFVDNEEEEELIFTKDNDTNRRSLYERHQS